MTEQEKYLGVRFVTHGPHAGKFVATLNHNQQKIHCGAFADPIPAARARDLRALKLYGETAVLNFPIEDYQR